MTDIALSRKHDMRETPPEQVVTRLKQIYKNIFENKQLLHCTNKKTYMYVYLIGTCIHCISTRCIQCKLTLVWTKK